jgi:hypothetical protein
VGAVDRDAAINTLSFAQPAAAARGDVAAEVDGDERHAGKLDCEI